jgi:hypothetical protein
MTSGSDLFGVPKLYLGAGVDTMPPLFGFTKYGNYLVWIIQYY